MRHCGRGYSAEATRSCSWPEKVGIDDGFSERCSAIDPKTPASEERSLRTTASERKESAAASTTSPSLKSQVGVQTRFSKRKGAPSPHTRRVRPCQHGPGSTSSSRRHRPKRQTQCTERHDATHCVGKGRPEKRVHRRRTGTMPGSSGWSARAAALGIAEIRGSSPVPDEERMDQQFVRSTRQSSFRMSRHLGCGGRC